MLPAILERIIEGIKRDVESGSAELANRALEAFVLLADHPDVKGVDELRSLVRSLALELSRCRPTMLSIRNASMSVVEKFVEASRYTDILEVLRGLLKDAAYSVLEERRVVLERIKRIAREVVQRMDKLMTFSYSSTVVSVILDAGKSFTVYIGESRPLMEGRKVASMLAEHGMNVILTTDAALGYFLPDVDAVLVGADAILADGSFVNKVGTFQLACASKFLGKQFIVIADSWKFSEGTDFLGEEHGGDEVVSPEELYHPTVRELGIEVRNPYFERIPSELVSYYITEHGLHTPQEVLRVIKERASRFRESIGMLGA